MQMAPPTTLTMCPSCERVAVHHRKSRLTTNTTGSCYNYEPKPAPNITVQPLADTYQPGRSSTNERTPSSSMIGRKGIVVILAW
ncbi:hypothetical protein HanLR1_Chr03g0115491 [Helianthus annuus]|nr:hypothetical protein HanLR1_Chr03g0115491 [Helianthus annuus]